jgi:hypothetical protein
MRRRRADHAPSTRLELAPARPALPVGELKCPVAALSVDPHSDEKRLALDDAVNANLVVAGVLHTTIRNAGALQAVPTGFTPEPKRLAGQTSVRPAEEGFELFVA